MKLNAYHLPALSRLACSSWSYSRDGIGAVELRVPRLTPQLLSRQVDALLEARKEHLADRPVLDVAAAIGVVARRLLDPGDELRRRAETAVAAVSGLSRPMSSHVIEHMAADWTEEALRGLLVAEFGHPAVLDGFVSFGNRRGLTRAFGPALTFHSFSGNVPGVAVTSLIRSLLVKAAGIGKTASGEPILAALFAAALAEVDAGLGACLAVTYWAGGDETLEGTAMERSGAIVAYGSRESIEALRGRAPREIPFLGYGNRASFGVISRDVLSAELAATTAADAAMAVAAYDQQGCVSPHLFYAEEGGDIAPVDWAEMVAHAMDRLEVELPRGLVAPGEAGAIRQARAEAEFGQLAGRGHRLYASPAGTSWTVIVDPDPSFVPSCLNRLVRIKPVGSIEEVPGLVAPLGSVLQTVGWAGPPERLETIAGRLGVLGVSRIAPLDRVPWPPPEWHHDGRPPLADLVRWCDRE